MQVVARKNEKWYKDSCKRIRGLTQTYENHISEMFLLPTILGVVLFAPKNDDQQNLFFVISCQPLEK